MPAHPTPAFEDALAQFFRAARRARGRAARRDDDGLSLAQYHLLEPLLDGPTATGQLAEAAGVAGPTATRMLDGLVASGRVERGSHPVDRRCVLVSLTPEGRALVEAKREAVARARARIAAALTEEDRRVGGPILLRIAEALEEL